LRRYDQNRGVQFLNFIHELTALSIQPFDSAALAKAARFARKFADQRLTLADGHGLAIMAEEHTRVCWSTDRHLSLTGVPLVM